MGCRRHKERTTWTWKTQGDTMGTDRRELDDPVRVDVCRAEQIVEKYLT